MNNKAMNSAFVGYEELADLGGCYPRPSPLVDNTLLDHILLSLIH